MQTQKTSQRLLLLAAILLLPRLVFGYGSAVINQDAEATARGNAFSATADNPAAIYYNPAGIMQLDGLNIESGVYGISIDDNYKPLHGEESAHESTAHEPIQPVPQFYATYHPSGQVFAFGLGVYAPFGLATEWPDDSSFRQAGLDGSLRFIDINPTFAVQITRSLSVGIGISADYLDATLRDGLTSEQGDYLQFKGNGLTIGGNVGILWKPTERQAIGITYHSPVSGDLTGHTQMGLNGQERGEAQAATAQLASAKQQLASGIAKINSLPIPASEKAVLIANAQAQFNAGLAAAGVTPNETFPTTFPTLPATGSLHFPQYVTLGYSFRPTPEWNLEADIQWTDWDSLNDFVLNRSGGSTITVPFNWTNSFVYELGATRTIGDYRISLGYDYSENSVPAASFSPTVPDSNRNVFSVGIGRTFGKCSVDVSYQLGIGVPRTVVNNTVADGRYTFLSNAVSVSLGYHF